MQVMCINLFIEHREIKVPNTVICRVLGSITSPMVLLAQTLTLFCGILKKKIQLINDKGIPNVI